MIAAGTTNLGYVTSVFPGSKVTPGLLTSSVGEIEIPRNLVRNFCMIMSVFSGLSFTFTPSIHF